MSDSVMIITMRYSMGISTVWEMIKDVWNCEMPVVMQAPNQEGWKEIATCFNKWMNFTHSCETIDDMYVMS